MNAQAISTIVIAGAGTAGWMTAAALAKHFQNTPVKIRLVAASDIGTIGVGEATIPTIRPFIQSLGLDEMEMIRATRATIKLAIAFKDWNRKGTTFFHPFGGYGEDFGDVAFLQVLGRLRAEGHAPKLDDYCLGAALAKAGKFAMPAGQAPFYGAFFDWAYHLDAGLYADYLAKFAKGLRVEHIDARIDVVNLDPDSGHIRSLGLNTGTTIDGDLFIDCTGFQGLLIDKALGVGYEDYGQWLLCDRAYAVQSEITGPAPAPYTQVTARDAGWQWGIPLQHRRGNGYVYASNFTDDETALATLTANVPGKMLFEPRQIRFRPGRRAQAWIKNCVAIGLSSGFLEPLESTSIALIQNGIEKLKQLFPDKGFHPALTDEYNDMSRREFERVRDFIILHYYASNRDDTEFWRACKTIDLPDSLRHKIELYKARGHFVRYRWEMFHPQSWLAIYDGFGWHPQAYDPATDGLKHDDMMEACQQMADFITTTVAKAPTHQDYLDYCNRAAQPAKVSA